MQAQLLGIDATLDRLSGKIVTAHIEIDEGDAERRVAFLLASLTALSTKSESIKLGITDPGALARINELQAAIAGLTGKVMTIDFKANADQLAMLETEAARLAMDMKLLVPATDEATNRLAIFGRIGRLAGMQISLFDRPVKAVLGGVTVWHLLADAVIEFLAVLIPATVALVAFGAAAAPAVESIVKQMQHMQTVTEATSTSLYPLTGGFEKLSNAVRPQVYQLFGDALTVANAKIGQLTKLVTGAGHVLDFLAARSAVAIKTGGLQVFLAHAVTDLAKLGDIVGNIFGTIGFLLKSMPGYAQGILTFFDVISKGIENVSSSGIVQGALKVGLAFHGAFLYAGLSATAFAVVARNSLGVVSKVALAGGLQLAKLGPLGEKAAVGMLGFAAGAEKAAGLPWGWIALAAAGIGLLIYKIVTAKDATQQWFAGLEKLLQAQPAIRGFTMLQVDQAAVSQRLYQAQTQLAHTQQTVNTVNLHTSMITKGVNAAYQAQQRVVHDLTSEQKGLNDQAILYNSRLAKLAVTFGGVGAAQGILIAAGVTFGQMQDKSARAWLMILQEVQATQAAYKAMGQTSGLLGADMNALNIAASDQVTQMGKLNSAWDQVMTIVTGGQGAFITFQQDMISVNEAFQGTGKTGRVVTDTFAAASAAAKSAGASMTGLNAPSLQLRATWQAAFGGATQLIDALRMMTAITPGSGKGSFPLLTRAMKDTILQLVPFGRQSKATTAEMVSLAQQVNPNIHNFRELSRWLGNTKNPARDLNALVARMGTSLQNLAGDAQAMSTTLRQDVIRQFDLAKLAGLGASKAIAQVAYDVTHAGVSAAQKHQDLVNLYNILRKAGLGARDATALIETMTGAIFRIPKNTTVKVMGVVQGRGQVSFAGHGLISAGFLQFHAAGGRIPGYGGGDQYPAMLEGGETIVPKHLTPLVAPLMKAHHIKGFASGGIVGQLPKLEPFMATGVGRFEAGAFDAFAHAAVVAAARAQAAAIRRAQGMLGGSGAIGGDQAANKALAMRTFPFIPSQWPFFNALEMAEAGYNRFATNPSSGAYGIPQALPPTKMPFAAQAAGGSHAGPQLSWMYGYIKSRWGSPAGAWANEAVNHWYSQGGKVMDRGGWIPPGPSMVINRTGRAEHLSPAPVEVHYHVHVDPVIAAVTPSRRLGQHIAEHIKMATKAGTRLYGPGQTPR